MTNPKRRSLQLDDPLGPSQPGQPTHPSAEPPTPASSDTVESARASAPRAAPYRGAAAEARDHPATGNRHEGGAPGACWGRPAKRRALADVERDHRRRQFPATA